MRLTIRFFVACTLAIWLAGSGGSQEFPRPAPEHSILPGWQRMTTPLAPVFTVALVVTTGAQDGDAIKLNGTWVLVRGEQDGQPLSEDAIQGIKMVIAGDKHTLIVRGDKMVSTHHLDPTTKPKSIDAKATQGPYKDKSLLGIYRIEGDEFTVCFAAPGNERPKDFTSKAGTGAFVHVWKRQKP
jgi:uncharacterized protein (TIGR03067 family)